MVTKYIDGMGKPVRLSRERDGVLALDVGDEVVCNTLDAGYPSDQAQAQRLLKVGKKYTVAWVDVGRNSSTMGLKEFPGESFNTVLFTLPERYKPAKSGRSRKTSGALATKAVRQQYRFPGDDVKLTFKDIAVGEYFIAFPCPGDNEGHGGYKGGHHLFCKTSDKQERVGEFGIPKENAKNSKGVFSNFPDEMEVIKVVF